MAEPGATSLRRAAGRPRRSAEEIEQVRERIIAATRAEFGRVGYHGLTITKVIEQAGVTRTNFYHYYRRIEEPLAVVLDGLVESLTTAIDDRVAGVPYEGARVVAGIDAYLAWSLDHRDLMRSLYAGLHDPSSPVSAARQRGLAATTAIMMRDYEFADYDLPRPRMIDVFVNTVEYSCFRLHLDTDAAPADVAAARSDMVRFATALLGTPENLRQLADWLELSRCR